MYCLREGVYVTTVLLSISFAIIAIFFTYKLILFYTKTMIQIAVDHKHRETEIITESGLVPPQWKNALLVRFGSPGVAKWFAMRRLRKLISYFRHTPLVSDEASREIVLRKLLMIQETWRTKDWIELFPYE